MKLLQALTFTLCTYCATAQNSVTIGSNSIELKGTKVNELALVPTKSIELGNRTKEVTYFFDGPGLTFTQVTYTKDNNTTANVYTFMDDVTLNTKLSTAKSKIYKGGVAYIVTISCNQKLCATQSYYDSYSSEPTKHENSDPQITFATKAKAMAFMNGLKNKN